MAVLAEYKLKIARDAIEAKRNGVSLAHFARDRGVSYSTLYNWIAQVKANTVTTETEGK